MTELDAASRGLARRCVVAGALLMLAGLMLGAVGTHVVAARVTPQQLSSFETAVLYEMLHAIGLVLVGIVARVTDTTGWLRWSARLMGLGIVLFSGSICAVTAGAPHELLAVAPTGGLALMVSWALFALHAAARFSDPAR